MGNFDKQIDPVEQSIPFDFYRFTDKNFPPRFNSLTPRLQARIPKMFGWQMKPGYDLYIWIDSSCTLLDRDSVKWFIEKLGDADIALLKHPNRRTIQEEANYLKIRLLKNCPYITPRYKNELIDEQLKEVNPKGQLFASTALIYRNNPQVIEAMKEWWYMTSRFHSIDQLSLTHAVSKLKVNVIKEKYSKYLTYVRNDNNFLHS